MIDNLIVYIKTYHIFLVFVLKGKQTWKWFAISLIIGLVIILALEGFLISTILPILFSALVIQNFIIHHIQHYYTIYLYSL